MVDRSQRLREAIPAVANANEIQDITAFKATAVDVWNGARRGIIDTKRAPECLDDIPIEQGNQVWQFMISIFEVYPRFRRQVLDCVVLLVESQRWLDAFRLMPPAKQGELALWQLELPKRPTDPSPVDCLIKLINGGASTADLLGEGALESEVGQELANRAEEEMPDHASFFGKGPPAKGKPAASKAGAAPKAVASKAGKLNAEDNEEGRLSDDTKPPEPRRSVRGNAPGANRLAGETPAPPARRLSFRDSSPQPPAGRASMTRGATAANRSRSPRPTMGGKHLKQADPAKGGRQGQPDLAEAQSNSNENVDPAANAEGEAEKPPAPAPVVPPPVVEKTNRSELLDVIAEIKSRVQDKLGVVEFPIPQFILVGKQSVGKSRLIEALAGEVFNFVSGSLGSRRPTCLEFRLVPGYKQSRWYMFDKKSGQWDELPVSVVMTRMASAHESLGANVTSEPVYVRVEGERCCDMQIVDLPGFREFALDDAKQVLAEKIDKLVMDFMQDKLNVMLCVEEAGDAANLATLTKCRRVDPKLQRTILIRNKLDKYYRDLTPENVDHWLRGFGDLPENLPSFALTLPHWKEGQEPPMSFVELRDEKDEQDMQELKSRGASMERCKKIGFTNFSDAMTQRLETMLGAAISNILEKLKQCEREMEQQISETTTQMENANPNVLKGSVRQAGADFGDCLAHVMDGQLRMTTNTMTLQEELEGFHAYHETLGSDFMLLPSEEFCSLEDYIDVLKNDIQVPSMDVEINGGAQFRRLLFEVETFCRFSELSLETKKKDVVQARGVTPGTTICWRDVVVKLLNNEAHLPMRQRVRYIGERIRWFFCQQKDVILEFMTGLKDSPDVHMYSKMYTITAEVLSNNEIVKQLIYTTYDRAVEKQLGFFLDLFYNTLASTFSNPWVFLKQASVDLRDDDVCLTSFEDTKARIPIELDNRSGLEGVVEQWLAEIPMEPTLIDEAVDKTQMLCLKTFTYIRSQISDQIELFAESFFKLKMLRRLGDDMRTIELSQSDMGIHEAKQDDLRDQRTKTMDSQAIVRESIENIQRYMREKKSRK